MKEFINRVIRNTDVHKLEKLLVILIPVLTLVIIASIIMPTVALLRSGSDTQEVVYLPPEEPVSESASPSPSADAGAVQQKIYYDGEIYKYVFSLSDDGTLLSSGETEDTGVFPVDANGDGLTDFGLKLVTGESSADGHYETVPLFNADGTPAEGYAASLVKCDSYTPRGIWETEGTVRRYRYSNGTLATGLKTIGGRLCYFNQNGEAASKLGIDVSFYNGYINWPQVKLHGIDFAIIRVGGRGWQTGSIYADSAYERNITEAQNAGMKLGVYFYSTAVNAKEAEEEARYVISKLNGLKLDMPVYIDVEQSGNYPRGRMDTLNKSQRAQVINTFCRVVSEAGYRPGVYSAQHYFTCMVDFSSVSAYDIWLANYTSYNRMPTFKNHYELWQFTPYGRVNGISGVVDMNAVFD